MFRSEWLKDAKFKSLVANDRTDWCLKDRKSRNRKCTTLSSRTQSFIVSDTDSDTDNESAVRISFSTSGSQCMVMITAVGLSNKYLNRPICFEMLVL